MKQIKTEKKTIDLEQKLGEFASSIDCKNVIDEDSKVFVNGKLSLVYLSRPEIKNFALLCELVNSISYTFDKRMGKKPLKSKSRNFGYRPRVNLRKVPCGVFTLFKESKKTKRAIELCTDEISKIYKSVCVEKYDDHLKKTGDSIPENYRFESSPFTSGVINKSSRMPYHFDAGNIKGCWSAMLGISDGVVGGDLCLPEIDCRLKISNGSLCFFNGQGLLHGVSKFYRKRPDAERYTIVWYSLHELWRCLSAKEELKRINQLTDKIIERKVENAKGLSQGDD
jgi:hypothetical protein